ncbi:potassium transporter Kup [Rhizobium sp. BR 314]|uniref:potassium transporter Kup n=1 Tax=Rhizobium sp. BR 314 TaxID=3040013 RepID=UPI0039BF6B17
MTATTDTKSLALPPKKTFAMPLAALGIVYGDIGTSPLYALKEAVRAAANGSPPVAQAVIGAVSVIFWALIFIVSLKYAVLILRADNRGEGGIVAMLALLHAREAPARSPRAILLVVGLVGAALLYGDGTITPAVSVLSAVEGLKVDAPSLSTYVVPITIAVLVGLFAVQRYGTSSIGRVFGPIMLLWFIAIGLLGLKGLLEGPAILAALNPLNALEFLLGVSWGVRFAMLGAAFLAVTGGEAMYADMGHFGRGPIRAAWFGVVLPALTLNYLGQGGHLLAYPAASDNPFFQLSPDWAHYPMVFFATAATVIASQAIISGAFSLTQQSIQLGFLPRMHVKHTAAHEIGQIYIPFVNVLLAIGTIAAVLVFRSSDALAGAYGIAVSALMIITTVLAALIARQWGYNLVAVVAVNGSFFIIDAIFFSANSLKLLEGGWFPLLLAALIAFVMLTWRRGEQIVERMRVDLRHPEDEMRRKIADPNLIRLPGAAVFLTSAKTGMPLAMANFLRHNHALHKRILLITVQSSEQPRIADAARTEVSELGFGVSRVVISYGFTEQPDVPHAIQKAVESGILDGLDPRKLSYIIGSETIIPSEHSRAMSHWREILFAFVQHNSERSAVWFKVPPKQAVEFGTEIEI